MNLNYCEVKAWLDRLILLSEEEKRLEYLTPSIKASSTRCDGEIHIYNGIEVIADIMDLPLSMSERDCNKYPYKYYFFYKGIEFFQISETRISVSDCEV